MIEQAPPPKNVYSGVYHALIVGMSLSTALYAIGVIRALWHPEFLPLDAAWVRSQYHWAPLWHGLIHLEPGSLMLAATVVLILTPVARVIIAMLAFWADHDYKYVLVTGIVLVVMALTVVLGRLGLH